MSLHCQVFTQILGSENGPVWKDYFEGGATWAFDVGSQSMTCPIIVEDLDRPRQMLVRRMPKWKIDLSQLVLRPLVSSSLVALI